MEKLEEMKSPVEYGSYEEGLNSRKTYLETIKLKDGCTRNLIHKTAGYEPGGSLARWTNEAWGSIYYDYSQCSFGQWFKTLEEAKKEFELKNQRDRNMGRL
jgi:hypothetical protein